MVEQTRVRSARVALARLAQAVVALEAGVAPTRGLGRWATFDQGEAVDGVVASEDGHGRIELELHLVLEWPPQSLPNLAEKLRAELRRDARRAGLGDRLGAIAVSFHDLKLPEPSEAQS